MSLPIDPRIFRAYDIRGIADEQLTRDACFQIAHAFGTELQERYRIDRPRVCVGRDARTHGPAFEEAVIEGLCESGCDVVAIGQTPSPVNHFTVCTQKLDGGMQVTASHNPAGDNGLKLSTRRAEAFSGEELQKLRKRIEQGRMRSTGNGEVKSFDAVSAYADHLTELFRNAGKGFTVVVDSGNGVAGPLYCEVLKKCGAKIVGLYTEPDGTFPNHPADPGKQETLKEAQALVRTEKANMGLGFDGDGDRLGCIDEEGTIRSADEILLLLAKDYLSRHHGKPVVFTVSNSGMLDSEIRALGGEPVMCKVGHSFVEHAMREHSAALGGEQSGHFFCAEDYFGFDDALVAALRVLKIVKGSGKPLGELCDDFPAIHQIPEVRPFVPDEHKTRIVEDVTMHFGKTYPVITLDGARIDFGDGSWATVRSSNTAPRLSICIEARSPEALKEIEKIVFDHLKKYPEIGWEE
ncbi:phosphomannomutase/phosphoglucomutase [Candidatus Peregrinibacteria bacterium]|nr:phosphomannomutase/phosphoglucomutase [Candidatus Peregrinibacteria bacterium]